MKRPSIGEPEAAEGRAQAVDTRPATDNDAEGLARLLGAAFLEMDWDAARARTDLLGAADVAATFVVAENDRLLATASARYLEQRFPDAGYVHWVAVDPAARGRGLFDMVMGAVMAKFAADGHRTAILETDDARLPAIAAYLRLGYIPQYPDSDHEARWSRIFMQLAESRRGKR